MGYRDELVRRMQEDGSWNQLTGDLQAQVRRYTDEQARQCMVLWDHWDMRDANTQALVGNASLYHLLSLFKMNLVEMANTGEPPLSRAGFLLADFVRELRSKGLSLAEIESGFGGLHSLAIGALVILSETTKD